MPDSCNDATKSAKQKPDTPCDSSKGTCAAATPTPPTCTLTSQTIATSPANRNRTKIGVGEEVTLTYSPGSATWSKTGTGTLSSASGATITFIAGEIAESVTITAVGSGGTCTMVFTIVLPTFTMKRKAGSNLKHTNGRPDCGWFGSMFMHPNDVNFYRLETREKNSQFVGGTGSYAGFNGASHQPITQTESIFFPVASHTDADGSLVGMADDIYSGDPGIAAGTAVPFIAGVGHFPITWQWRVLASTVINDFPATTQELEILNTGLCKVTKASHSEQSLFSDPTSTR